MKNFIIVMSLLLLFQIHFAQSLIDPNAGLDASIDSIWNQPNNNSLLNVGPESLGKENIIAPLIPPARSRQVPGTVEIILPIEETDGPLNLSPNDAKAYIIYNRATIAFRNQQYERARELYRDLIRRYPDSSYTPYALYVLSLSERDYRRKIRILLTITERFPQFPHRELILDSLGDIYYLLDSPDAALEVFTQSTSAHASYMKAMIVMDAQQPNRAITFVRQALQLGPNNEKAYQIYMLYVEALVAIKSYENVLIVLQKAVELRPWAYDNGGLILLNAGKSFYHMKKYSEALYTFSLLRLRFSRTIESRLADQYLVALGKLNVVSMRTVPWLASSFETIIKPQPVVSLQFPKGPSIEDIMQMNNLPPSAVPEPSLDGVTFLPPMPVPTPPQNTYSILVPLDNPVPTVKLITLTNTIYQEVTNTIVQLITNRVFVIETNTITNNLTAIDYQALTNITTNTIQIWETNTVVSYEPVILWRTNYRQINITNLVTNVVDYIVTNEKIELLPLRLTNYNFVNRPRSITNIIDRQITNRYLEYGLDNTTNWKEEITTRRFMEIIPAWKTTYQSVDTNQLVTNVIRNIVTNQRLELVPRWIDNLRTNDVPRIVNEIITNTRLRIAPRWITNYQIIQTNMRDVEITNVINTLRTNVTEQIVTNLINITHNRTNFITNIIDIIVTNQDNQQTQTNFITNISGNIYQQTNIITNISQQIQTNFVIEELDNINQTPPIEIAPVETSLIFPIDIDEAQIDFILEPLYTASVEEEQVLFVSDEVARLELQAAKFAEKSAGVAGKYGVSDNKGFVIRIAQLKDLSVANIVLRDVNDLDLGISVGIYYRDEFYFVEIRSLNNKKFAEKIAQELYQNGYTDVQMFEQYEVTEYQEE